MSAGVRPRARSGRAHVGAGSEAVVRETGLEREGHLTHSLISRFG